MALASPSAASSGAAPARVDGRGVHVALPGGGAFELRLRALARGGLELPLEAGRPGGAGARREILRPELREWYVRRGAGLEQGFTLTERPLPAGDEPLALRLDGPGALSGTLAPDERSAVFHDASGRPRVRYEGLAAWDADGRELAARLTLAPGRVTVEVADAGARYPLTIDPQIVVQEAKIVAADGTTNDHFGIAVAVHADTMVGGADQDDPGPGTNTGSAYVFQRSGTTWVQEAKLVALDAAANDRFGCAVDVHEDTVLVGSSRDDDFGSASGSAYVFARSGTTWSQQAKLLPLDGALGDFFGSAVGVDEDTIVVGADGDDDLGAESGSAYVFERTGTVWTQTAKLLASDGAAFDNFGAAVAIHNDTIVVGAWHDNQLFVDTGAAYVFVRSGTSWVQETKLSAGDQQEGDFFGVSVAIHQSSVVIGADSDDDNGFMSGSAYVFSKQGTQWLFEDKLRAPDGASGDLFGRSVGIFANSALVGSPGDADLGVSSGSAYVFQRSGTTWSFLDKALASDGQQGDGFGTSVSLQSDTGLVGAWQEDPMSVNAGSCYTFNVPQPPTMYCQGKFNSLGCVPYMSFAGTASVTDTSPFTVSAHDTIPGQAGFLLYGYAKANLDFHGGKLCVKSPERLLPPKAASSAGPMPCQGILSRNLNAPIQAGVDPGFTIGSRVHVQWRQRDGADPFGDSLSNAVQFTICP